MSKTDEVRTDLDHGPPSGVVTFTEMQAGTAADYLLLRRYEQHHADGLPDRILRSVESLDGSLGGYRITRLEHSLQSATRARLDGANVDWVVAALLHDLGDELAPHNHSEYAAAILGPYVAAEVRWVVLHHGVFQSHYYAHHLGGDRHERDRYADHRWADLCVEFCARWDQNSFDPDFPNDPLESFVDDVRTVFSRSPWDPAVVGVGTEQLR